MGWEGDVLGQVVAEFVEAAAQHDSDIDFARFMLREQMLADRRERARDRMAIRRAIARGERGFVIEERTCKKCGKPFPALKHANGRPRKYCCRRCENAACQGRARARRRQRKVVAQ